jgi:glycosyltransferase involved in cell wall biosynthesis
MASHKKDITIGIKASNYPERRNFSELPIPGYTFEKIVDFYKIPAYIYFKIKGKPHPYWLNFFQRFGIGNHKVLHFFNAINLGNKPWITTFEYYLPRGAHQYRLFSKENKYIDTVISRLADPSCKKLIALSNFALNAQKKYLSDYGKFKDEILKKTIVQHPSQKNYFQNISEKPASDQLKLVFVGADFFRKGGLETLEALDILLNSNYNLSLTIVSSMQYGDYASNSTKKDVEKAFSIIKRHKSIMHHYSLQNKEVIDLFKEGSIALLPTYDETYGYTILEAQSCGCPVITTNGGALYEINNNSCGWIIKVPLEKDGRSIPRTTENREVFKTNVINGIINILKPLTINQEEIKIKGQKSIERIKNEHSVESAAKVLLDIYNSITL